MAVRGNKISEDENCMQECKSLLGKKVQVKKKGKQLVFGAENRSSGACFYSLILNTSQISSF